MLVLNVPIRRLAKEHGDGTAGLPPEQQKGTTALETLGRRRWTHWGHSGGTGHTAAASGWGTAGAFTPQRTPTGSPVEELTTPRGSKTQQAQHGRLREAELV